MHGFNPQEIWVCTTIWAIAFMASVSRAIRDDDCKSCWHGVSLGSTAGFVSLGIIGLFVGDVGNDASSPVIFWCVSALIGVSGKEQDRYVKIAMSKVLKVSMAVMSSDKDQDNSIDGEAHPKDQNK